VAFFEFVGYLWMFRILWFLRFFRIVLDFFGFIVFFLHFWVLCGFMRILSFLGDLGGLVFGFWMGGLLDWRIVGIF